MTSILSLSNEKIKVIAKELGLSEDELMKQSLVTFLERKLKEIKAEIYKIMNKYMISSIEDFERLYEKVKIEEKDSFEDFKRLDHLEFKKEEIDKILKELK
uniref:Uncharacterized protein n=1 Tax=Dictyoglomus thermophilum TaxID=14 RepID=A0A7C3RLB5_DICTH